MRFSCFFIFALVALVPLAADATMPVLDEMPPVRTDQTCWAWATKEAARTDDDIAEMWGMLDDGNYDPAVAVRRLADNCIGKPKPEIVGVGSSIGYYNTYCRHHPRQTICHMKNLGAQCVGNRAMCAKLERPVTQPAQ